MILLVHLFSVNRFYEGVSQTDWSWTPLVQDFDNDGIRDMIVTNGFPKDVTDHDFILTGGIPLLWNPPLKCWIKYPRLNWPTMHLEIPMAAFLADVTANWGLTTPSFSNGAAYADLDNDGDMDMVVNNINDDAFLYKNTLARKGDTTNHFLQIKCIGSKQNINGIGAWIDIYYDKGKHQVYENTPYRGYLSTGQNIAHFGLGKTIIVDSVVVKWPEGKKQTIMNVHTDQMLTINSADAVEPYWWQPEKLNQQPLFKQVTKSAGFNFTHYDQDFIDFNIQSTLPHKLSEYRPALAAADVDGNGFDDIVIGGNSFSKPRQFLQQPGGKFIQKELSGNNGTKELNSIDEGVLLFDANGDQSPDLYVASGGYSYERDGANYQDRLYINNGKGEFTIDESALPLNHTSKLCVKAMDFNKDGKLDLFVSGRVDPQKYPKPVSSFIFRNDSEGGKVKFTDVTKEVAPDLINIGLVCDALFTDFDNDEQVDLIITGEWMPVTFLKNENGKFKNVTQNSGVGNKAGWWNSIVSGDFRHTGKTDYILGNVGLNTLYQVSEEYPVFITAKDFDKTGGYVPITSLFLPGMTGELQEFPAEGRDDIFERIPSLRKRYSTYHPFAAATMKEIFPESITKDAQRLKATMLQSCFLRNEGNGKFTMIPLPKEAQVSVVNGMVADDFDGDGNLDVLLNGNDFGTEVSIGRFDALNGLLLKGNGQGEFIPLSILQSGIYIPGNGKALIKLLSGKGSYLVAASQYKDALKIFELNRSVNTLRVNSSDQYALIKYKNGTTEKKEFYYGNSFLSQSARFMELTENMTSVTIMTNKGESRSVRL